MLKSRVKNKSFTIISSNCWGASVYQELDLPYRTPFVGLYLFAPCYIQLLTELKSYLESPLEFVDTSRYEFANKAREVNKYPIGLLGGSVEIQFLHYSTISEARDKWTRRVSRVNWDNIFVSFTDRDLCTVELLEEFDNLPFDHKVCFTAKHYPHIQSAVWISECRFEPYTADLLQYGYLYKKHFDVANWLNGGAGEIGAFVKLLNTLLLPVRNTQSLDIA